MGNPKARIAGNIVPGAKVFVSIHKGVFTTDCQFKDPDFPHAVGKIEHGELKLTPEGEKILAAK